MTITRLGEGLEAGGAIRPDAAARTAAAVDGFVALAESSGAPPPTVVGTYALRIARNPEELLARLSVPIRVLEGQEEARLGFYGALAGLESLPPATRLLVVDIGGGSIEVSYGTARGMTGSLSLPLGAVTLTQQFLRHDPPRTEEIAALHSHLARTLNPHLSRLRGRRFRLIGVGGTITTMAALAQHLDPYDPEQVHGFRLRAPTVDAITADLLARPLADRRRLRGLQPERADIISAGALTAQHILRTLGQRSMTVSEADLLWGVVLDL
jgi:exopolyphosphatase / guanosine-5'-triphosphate,3'-diphosphate pyrophosphatase